MVKRCLTLPICFKITPFFFFLFFKSLSTNQNVLRKLHFRFEFSSIILMEFFSVDLKVSANFAILERVEILL